MKKLTDTLHAQTRSGSERDESAAASSSYANEENEDEEFELTRSKTHLPLAVSGAIGGFCNTGVQLVIPRSQKIDFFPGHGGWLFTEFLIYAFFSVTVGAVLGPAVAMLSIGMPRKQNWNRLLVASVIFGTFLTITIDTAQKSISSSARVEEKEKAVEKKEKAVEEKEKAVEDAEAGVGNVNNAANDLLKESLPAVSEEKSVNPTNINIRIAVLEKTGCPSNNVGVIKTNINDLKELKNEIKPTEDANSKKNSIEKINGAIGQLDKCLNILNQAGSAATPKANDNSN